MQNRKIVYVCNFSSEEHRKRLKLRNWKFRNWLFDFFKKEAIVYKDYGPWNGEFFKSFEKDSNNNLYYVMYPHTGVVGKYQQYSINGVSYYAINSDVSLFSKIRRRISVDNKKNYQYETLRKIYFELINKINPDLLVICGLEIPECIVAFQDNFPVFVMLQTLLNRQISVQYSVGTETARIQEQKWLQRINYIGCPLADYYNTAIKINPLAYYFKISFPTTCPPIYKGISLTYDFVFFAGSVMKNKGVEDAIHALALVCKQKPQVSLNIIGKCNLYYRKHLDDLIGQYGIEQNVIFNDYFPIFEDVYKQIQKSRYALLPSITAPFNTTVREALFLGKPTIVYRTSVTQDINERVHCFLEAKMEDVNDLALKMIYALENPTIMSSIGESGKYYAETSLSSSTIGNSLIKTFSSIIGKEYENKPIEENLLYNSL